MNKTNRDGRKIIFIGAVPFVLSFSVYILSLCPTVYWYDSGELISACFNLGIAHPTGYPLYTVAGRIFSLLPFGHPAFRINLLSALFGSLTVVIVYAITKEVLAIIWGKNNRPDNGRRFTLMCREDMPAIVASLTFAFSPLLWTQTLMAEVYTLHTFFIALLILCLFRWSQSSGLSSSHSEEEYQPDNRNRGEKARRNYRYVYLFSFILGLSLCHHLTTLLFLPAFLFFFLATDFQTSRNVKMLTTAFLFFLLGLSADLYLLLRARLDPIQNWGDPGTWERLLDVVIGAEIRTRPTRYAAHTITELFTLLGKQFLLPGTALGAIGILSTIRRKKTVFVFFTLFFMGMALYILRNYDFLEDQYLPVFLVFSVWIGLGVHEILSFTASIRAANYSHMKAFIGPVISVLILSVPFSLLALNYTSVEKHDHRVAYNFGEKILEHLDEGAIFLSEGSNIPLLLDYFQRVEGRRTDVANVYLFLMEFDWYRVQLSQRFPNISVPILPDNIVLRLIEQNVKDRSVYYVPFSKEPNVDVGRLIPHGLFFRIEQKQTIPSRSELEEHFLFQGRFYSTLTRSLDQDSKDILAQLHGTMGLYFERIGMYDEAYKEYTKALEIDSLNPGVHYDLGSLAMGRGSFKEAIQDFQKVLEFEPSNVTTRYLLAQCYAHDGQLIPALREMEEVVRTEPHEPLFHTELGTLYGQMGRTELAIEQFRQALEYDPYNADILYNLGIAEALSDHLDMALQHLKQAEQQDTNRTEITYALASSYAQKRDFREAEYYYLRTLKLGGQQPSVLRDLGYLYAESGNAVKAIETWEAALALDPSNAQLQHELVRLRHRMRTDGKPD